MLTLFVIWCLIGLIHWLYIVFKEGCILGEDLVYLPFCILLGAICPVTYWINKSDPIYITLRRKK